jgi:hypothetical protein
MATTACGPSTAPPREQKRLCTHHLEAGVSVQAVAFDYAETGSGPAVLFLPGSFGTGTGWKAVMGYLGDG